MRASVIVPLFNKAGYLERALASIAAQRLTEFEVIIVDDGSTDGGDRLAARWSDPRFRLIRQPNAGPGAARNRGAAEARAAYIAFLDADDAWMPGFLETNVRLMDAHPAALAVSGAAVEFPAGVPTGPRWAGRGLSEGLHNISPATSLHVFDALVSFMTPSMTMVRAEALRRYGGFQEEGCRFAEDGALWLKLLLNGAVCVHFESLTEFHRETAELSGNYGRARPVEPYLANPEPLRRMCPAGVRSLLERFFAARACKTACMLGYWGEWRRARSLLREFVSPRDWNTPLFAPAWVAATPVGALAGKLLRSARKDAKAERAAAAGKS